jgi:hypothetical protein
MMDFFNKNIGNYPQTFIYSRWRWGKNIELMLGNGTLKGFMEQLHELAFLVPTRLASNESKHLDG